jgi:glutathione S-transferase
MDKLRLYDYFESGNAYKVRLLLSLLGIPFERVHLDILKGETRSDAFLAKNPNHRVPLLEWPDGRVLAESNAILFHLAEGTPWLPDDAFLRAQVLQWMCFEQYSHEPYIAVLRFWTFAGKLAEHNGEEIAAKRAGGLHALDVMEEHLQGRDWFVGEHFGIADIALFAYTHVAHEGGFDLSPFGALRGWIGRVEAQPGFVSIEAEVGELVAWPPSDHAGGR